jgi:hypothetical protein
MTGSLLTLNTGLIPILHRKIRLLHVNPGITGLSTGGFRKRVELFHKESAWLWMDEIVKKT